MPSDHIVTMHASWPEKGDPLDADSPPPAGVPPDLGVWILDFQHPGSNRIWQSIAVPNSFSLRLTGLMMGYTRIGRAHDMVVGGYDITPTLSRLLSALIPVESPQPGGGYLYVGQRVDGDP